MPQFNSTEPTRPGAPDPGPGPESPRNGNAADPPSAEGDERDERLAEILDAYLMQLRQGTAPDRAELLANHPDLAVTLDACLSGLEFIRQHESTRGTVPGRLGDFQVVREIGRGGMGVVYEAEQISLRRRVAVKVLHFSSAMNRDAVDRFRREAATVAQLHHTNIVPIYFVGQEAGVNYFAMQFISGRSLADVLRDSPEPLPAMTVVDWALQAAEALGHAHQRGVIHRDVKPSNLLLDADDRIWLTDFGLAKHQEDATLSEAGAVLGTPRYMSPEQASASTRNVDERSDIYSLGATCYELVTGRPVFQADSPHQILVKIVQDHPLAPRTLIASLPRDLDTVLLKCLAKNPEQRYSNAQELAEDLRAIREERPIRARRISWWEHSGRWLQKNRPTIVRTMVTAAVTLGIVLVLALTSRWHHRRIQSQLSLTTSRPPLTAELRSDDGELVAHQTVPTEEPVTVPEGRYELRVSGAARLSETYRVDLRRNQSLQLDLDLSYPLLSPTIEYARAIRLVEMPDQPLAVTFDDTMIRGHDLTNGNVRWSASAESANQPLLQAAPGWIWPWYRLLPHSAHHGWGPYDLRPHMTPANSDLDADGHPDMLLTLQHQACVVAISGVDGRWIWVAARGSDLHTPVADLQQRADRGVLSAVLAPPTPLGDINGNGSVDFVISLMEQTNVNDWSVEPKRWVEAIDGASGATIWQHEFAAEQFVRRAGSAIALAFRWYPGSHGAHSETGGGFSSRFDRLLTRRTGHMERVGYYHHAQGSPLLLRWSPTDPHSTLTILTGSQWQALDPRTGEASAEPLPCPFPPYTSPLAKDIDGDGTHELVIMAPSIASNGQATANTTQLEIGVMSLAQRKLLWSATIVAEPPQWRQPLLPLPAWPLLVDLDDDGRDELIVPNGTSQPNAPPRQPWGELEVRNALTGEVRWKRRLRTMDQQLDHFLPAVDVDGDGVREVVVASLWSDRMELYVDTLSGRSGETLCFGHHALSKADDPSSFLLAPPLLWRAGQDGWPQIVVTAHGERDRMGEARVCVFSTRDAALTHSGHAISQLQLMDANNDGLDDLFAMSALQPSRLDFGGTLVAFRGFGRQLWNELGGIWQPTVDLNQDGVRDLVRGLADGTIEAISGADAAPLWQTRFTRRDPAARHVAAALPTDNLAQSRELLALTASANQPAQEKPGERGTHPGDFDRDGTIDLLVYDAEAAQTDEFSPLSAVSGRTGALIWQGPLRLTHIQGLLALDVRDLDGDGYAEVIWVGSSNWNLPDRDALHVHDVRLQLAVINGRDGQLRWHQPLTPRYGHFGASPVSPYGLIQKTIAVTFADVNGDGTLDVFVPAHDDARSAAPSHSQTPRQMLRIFSGANGDSLADLSLPAPREPRNALSEIPPPLVADLDGDQRDELVTLTFAKNPDTDQSGSVAIVTAYALKNESTNETSDERGQHRRRFDRPLWTQSIAVPDSCGRIFSAKLHERNRPRPQLLRRADGPPLILLNLSDGGERVVVLSAVGQLVRDFQQVTARGFSRGNLRMVPCDVDGDGTDELILPQYDKLMAVDPLRPEKPIWSRTLGMQWGCEIIAILPATHHWPQRLMVRHTDAAGAFEVWNAANGTTMWTVPVAAPQEAGRVSLVQPDDVGLLADGINGQRPQVFAQRGLLSRVQEALIANTRTSLPGMQGIDNNQPVRRIQASSPLTASRPMTSHRQRDPRLELPLPWRMTLHQLPAYGSALAWTSFYGVTLLLLPIGYLIYLVRHRPWGLRHWLALPMIVGVFLLGLLADAPEMVTPTSNRKLLAAAVALPALLLAGQVAVWLARRQWGRLVAWWMLTWLLAAVAGWLILRSRASHPALHLDSDQYYSRQGWWAIWFFGAYASSYCWLAYRAVCGGWRAVLRGLRGMRAPLETQG